jgi:hypothetical protein
MLAAILQTLTLKRFEIYTRPYELNIVGVRSDSTVPNRFDDTIHVFYKNDKNGWVYFNCAVTTDPGTYWLRNPLQQQGTAILKAGQYRDAYQIGLHRGKYEALVQRKAVTVIRDYDRDAVLDFNNGREVTGMFGINIHRASQNGTTATVDKYSAGCQVFANIQHFSQFIQHCKKHKNLYGNHFTYTLIDARAIVRQTKKTILLSIAGIGAGVGCAAVAYRLLK